MLGLELNLTLQFQIVLMDVSFLKFRIQTSLPFVGVEECNGLEEPTGPPTALSQSKHGIFFETLFTPFQVKSFLLHFI